MNDFYTIENILQTVRNLLGSRGQVRDQAGAERSMKRVVEIFNLLEDLELTEEQGWRFMQVLKMVRQTRAEHMGKTVMDDYYDNISYSVLQLEGIIRDGHNSVVEDQLPVVCESETTTRSV